MGEEIWVLHNFEREREYEYLKLRRHGLAFHNCHTLVHWQKHQFSRLQPNYRVKLSFHFFSKKKNSHFISISVFMRFLLNLILISILIKKNSKHFQEMHKIRNSFGYSSGLAGTLISSLFLISNVFIE